MASNERPHDEEDPRVYVPSPEEIKRRAAQIRKNWPRYRIEENERIVRVQFLERGGGKYRGSDPIIGPE